MAKVPVPAAKPKARAAAPVLDLEVASGKIPTSVYGKVTEIDEGFQIDQKRRQSPKIDRFVVPHDEVLAAVEGDGGYVTVGPDSAFAESFVALTVKAAKITDDEIRGTDASGNKIFVNRKLVDTQTRYVQYA